MSADFPKSQNRRIAKNDQMNGAIEPTKLFMLVTFLDLQIHLWSDILHDPDDYDDGYLCDTFFSSRLPSHLFCFAGMAGHGAEMTIVAYFF